MTTHSKTVGGLLILLLGLLLGLSAAIPGAAPGILSEGPLRGYLPGDDAVAGWTKDGEPQEYEGEDLYAYIDGGAEIYHEYGFRRVILQDYKNAGGKSVSLEIFEMETPAAAFGMFTFKRSGNGKPVELGAGAELEAYYLNIRDGRFLVTITGFGEDAETVGGILTLGRAVDSLIRDSGDAAAPALVAALPEQGLLPGSVKYLKGLLGLNNVFPFHTARGLDFREAVRGIYENGTALLILDYGSAAARAPAWLDLKAFLLGSDKFKPAAVGGDMDVCLFQDGKGQYVAFAESGPRLIVGISLDPAACRAIVRLAR